MRNVQFEEALNRVQLQNFLKNRKLSQFLGLSSFNSEDILLIIPLDFLLLNLRLVKSVGKSTTQLLFSMKLIV